MQNENPYQTQRDLRIAINNFLAPNIYKFDLKKILELN